MTVKELRDRLDNYIKTDPPDLWQLNDCELDALYYKERCEERGHNRVVIAKNSELYESDITNVYPANISCLTNEEILKIEIQGVL